MIVNLIKKSIRLLLPVLMLLFYSGAFYNPVHTLSAKEIKGETPSEDDSSYNDSDDEDEDGDGEYDDDDDEDDDSAYEEDDSEDTADAEEDDGILDSGYCEGWVDSNTLRVYAFGVCPDKKVKSPVAKEKAKKAAIISGQGKIVMQTGEVKKTATKDGWIKEFNGFVKGAMVIWERYDSDERTYHVILEVSFER